MMICGQRRERTHSKYEYIVQAKNDFSDEPISSHLKVYDKICIEVSCAVKVEHGDLLLANQGQSIQRRRVEAENTDETKFRAPNKRGQELQNIFTGTYSLLPAHITN